MLPTVKGVLYTSDTSAITNSDRADHQNSEAEHTWAMIMPQN